jgi:uncharacterized protein (UPF0297 family)
VDKQFQDTMAQVLTAIESAGYDPYAQLVGFLRTRDPRYITRNGNARELVASLDRFRLKQYVAQMKK